MEKCRRILNPEDFQVFSEDEEDFKKKRSENTVFKHDYLRYWDTVARLPSGVSAPISPKERTPKVNRRYESYLCGDSQMFNESKPGISPYPKKRFEETVIFRKEQPKTAAKPRGRALPSYMQHTKSSIKKFSLK